MLGHIPVDKITVADVERALKLIIERGSLEVARRVHTLIVCILKYSLSVQVIENPDIVVRLTWYKENMPKRKKKSLYEEELTPDAIGQLMLTIYENRRRDLFLFGYYTGGTTVNEMASLKISSIKKGYLYCKRNASENIAVIPLCSEVLHIIDKYQSMCFDDYLLPIFTHKHNSPEQQLGRIKRISELTNQTLRKVSKMLKLENVITMGMAKSIFIEHLLSNEVPYEKVAQYLGCSIETVLRHSEKMRQNYGE